MSSTFSILDSTATPKASVFEHLSLTFLVMESSTSTAIAGNSNDRFPATNSTPTLFIFFRDSRFIIVAIKIALGYDPAYLLPSLPQAEFVQAFDDAISIGEDRIKELSPSVWKAKRLLNIESEKRLKAAVSQVHGFAKNVIKETKQELEAKPSSESMDLLSRFFSSGQYDENFVRDIVISFILAGRDTTSIALTWFFWLLNMNPEV
ncbi:hypothetical protein LWI28_008187 [Acer negundo]|uniref:Cytochrome P450 n=1 Tax=Acer negundo TaxID=4023 RepID=A0AAD5J3F0_ACENE|nr:hypothetical protein LWI28_008187 [Acer negundo]KAK4847747.1 hypothetical protein QYF36_005428 [Acer negundo]KAK4849347.1 hypothetical protein QYF36_023856 [Acer negundo]